MVFKLIIKPIVIFDIEEALDYYEKKGNGLGKRRYTQFLFSLSDIRNKPLTYSYVKEPEKIIVSYFMKPFLSLV